MAESACLPFLDRLPLYVAGRLPSSERESLEAHFVSCAECQRELAFWQAVPGALASLDDEIPPDRHAATTWTALQRRLPPRPSVPLRTPRERAYMEIETRTPPRASHRSAPTPIAPRRARRPLLAVAACALIVILSATLFGILGSQSHHPTVAGQGTATSSAQAGCAPSRLRTNLPANASIADLSMASPEDGWAVGQIWDPQHSATPAHTLLMHLQSCVWSPIDSSIPDATLTSISMGSAGDGWAVGMTLKAFTTQNENGTTNYEWDGDQLIVLHYTRGSWQRVSLPGYQSVIDAKVRMLSSTEGWMVLHGGKSHLGPDTIAYAETVLHYSGGAWSIVGHDAATNPSATVSGFAGISSNDVWTVGSQLVGAGNYEYAVLAHYHAGVWTTRTDISGHIASVSFSSPSNGWAVGQMWVDNYKQSLPLILHYDGSQWTSVALPAPVRAANGAFLESVTAVSDSEAWAFGSMGPSGGASGPAVLALHYLNGQWTEVTWPLATIIAPHELVISSATQGFAIGTLALSSTTPKRYMAVPKGVILALNNGSWSVLPGQ